MTTLDTRSKDTIVGTIAAGMQAGLNGVFLNFAKGAVFRATAEAYAGVCLWLQKMALAIAKLTRLATSYGSDVDSWLADWGLITRLGAAAATGPLIFSRYSAGASSPYVPVGGTVTTGDGSLSFTVYADPTNGAYSATAGGTSSAPIAGYVMPAQVSSVLVPVQCNTAGTIGNVAAGAISLITSSMPGIDTVTNVAAFTNGVDQENDPVVKARFRLAIASLSKGTDDAIGLAITSLQVGLEYTIQNNTDYSGATDYGMVTVVVDDGSGNIPSALLATCQTAVGTVMAAGIRVGVYAATTIYADVVATITTATGYDHNTVVAQVVAALGLYINGLGLGNDLPFFDLAQIILGVPGVLRITALTLNNGTADLSATLLSTIKANELAVS